MKAKIETPVDRTDPSKVKIEEIPLPPKEMWGDLNNSGTEVAADEARKAEQVMAQKVTPRPIAKLNFRKDMFASIVLNFPFDHPDLGGVELVEVRRLTVGEVGDILDGRRKDAPDMFDIYEAMTGLPADVLRGLEAQDGERVTGACFDFLPPLLRPVRTD